MQILNCSDKSNKPLFGANLTGLENLTRGLRVILKEEKQADIFQNTVRKSEKEIKKMNINGDKKVDVFGYISGVFLVDKVKATILVCSTKNEIGKYDNLITLKEKEIVFYNCTKGETLAKKFLKALKSVTVLSVNKQCK